MNVDYELVEFLSRELFEHNPIVSNRSWDWCCNKLPNLAKKWRMCVQTALLTYESEKELNK